MGQSAAAGFTCRGAMGRLAATLCACFCAALPAGAAPPPATAPVVAGEAAAPAVVLAAWESGLVDAVLDTPAEPVDAAAPAQELAAGLDVQVTQKRRKFRARAIDWMSERSLAMGHMTDLLLGGADEGFHLVVDPSGDDQYILEWKVRFR